MEMMEGKGREESYLQGPTNGTDDYTTCLFGQDHRMHEEQDRPRGRTQAGLEQNLSTYVYASRRHTILPLSNICKLSYKLVLISTHEVN